jgi:endonuclease/exonuclease/phosphatase family metal-dependent hydrolase
MERKVASTFPGRNACWALTVLLLATPAAWGVKIATYNLLNYDGSSRNTEFRAITSALQADILITEEITSSSAPDIFLNQVLNGSGGPGGYAKATFHAGYDTNNALFYRTSKFTFGASEPDSFKVLGTELRDINRWRLRLSGYSSSGAEIYVYAMHLKASSGYEDQRNREAAVARDDANTLPAGTNFIYAGDLNLYTSSESAYVTLTGSGDNPSGQAFDPINRPGSWDNSITFAAVHTQSTRSSEGGMDSRFDFILVSASLRDSSGLDYVSGTYTPYGNDGQHFNLPINGGTPPFNNAVGLPMANTLQTASDHVPVLADFQVPPKGSASPASLAFGTAIVGGTVQRTLSVANTGDVALFDHVAPLTYTLPAVPSGFSGPSGAFAAIAGEPGNDHVYSMDTATAGSRSGQFAISTDADDNPSIDIALSGTVLGHARPSIASDDVVTTGTLDFGAHAIGGFANVPVQAYNYDFSASQALLEVYGAQVAGPDAARFNIVGGFSPATVGAAPASYAVAFDDSGTLAGTTYTATLTFQTRDQSGLAGAANLSDLTLALTAHVGGACHNPRFDYDADNDVDLNDFASLQVCFNGPNRPVSSGCACLDSDGDADVDLTDFAAFQKCFNGPNHPPGPECIP